jgi:integral membrane protein
MNRSFSPIPLLRHIAMLEGVSFLILLFIAMPLKYWANNPLPVRIFGMAHGVLFIAFIAALARAHFSARWPVSRSAVVFISSLVPFGPFLLDRRMRAWESEAQA